MCVGLTEEYAEQIDTYICGNCKQPADGGATVQATDGSTQKLSQPVYTPT